MGVSVAEEDLSNPTSSAEDNAGGLSVSSAMGGLETTNKLIVQKAM